MSISLRVGGRWLDTIAGWGELSWSTAADGGCKEASWKMDLGPRFSHPALTRNQIVEVKVGPWNLFKGLLTEPDVDDGWTFHAVGLSVLGNSNFMALDGSLNATAIPNTAVDQAIARGLPWKRTTSLSAVAFGETADPVRVGELLTPWADSESKRWGVDAQGEVYARPDPTTPTWVLTPDAGRFGLADDDYASSLFVRYLGAGGNATAVATDPTALAKAGPSEVPVDITSLGVLTATQATNYGNGLLAKGRAKMGYTNGLTVTKYQLTTPGGVPADLRMVQGGQLVRQFGVLDEQRQPVPYVDWVIGETNLEAGADSIGLTPVGKVSSTISEIIADALGTAS